MATYSRELRRGLPRVAGGDSWPPAASAPEWLSVGVTPTDAEPFDTKASAPTPQASDTTDSLVAADHAKGVSSRAQEGSGATALRRGLPRAAGSAPWPPATEGTADAPARTNASHSSPTDALDTDDTAVGPLAADTEVSSIPVAARGTSELTPAGGSRPNQPIGQSDTPLRRGLPRKVGDDPWPPAGFAPLPLQTEPASGSTSLAGTSTATESSTSADAPLSDTSDVTAPTAIAEPTQTGDAPRESPSVAPASSKSGIAPAAAAVKPIDKPTKTEHKPIMIGTRSLKQWVTRSVLFVIGTIAAAGIIVLAARGVTTLPGVPEFLKRYPGEYSPSVSVDEGFPPWARWTHYLNFFFMVLIVKTGLLVRTQQKPDAFYAPKRGGKKVSIYLWLHTSLDVLWLLNGILFVTMLFITDHWARIVPTSWDVFPNAASALLQYGTLQWPVEDGWVNYNSLQQLMYFLVVFIAAPLAAITGVRMSEWWPKNAERLNKAYPAPLARAVHFPVMLFFVLFVIIHVFLVFATGALRNLNHMFAGSPDVSWVGFWWFAAGLLVAVGAFVAARPLVIAPIANQFGKVTNR